MFDSFSRGWDRMVELMFRGPYANVRGWLGWGFVVLLSGALGGGMFQGDFPLKEGNWREWLPVDSLPGGGVLPAIRDAFSSLEPWGIVLLAFAGLLTIVLLLLVTWISSVFRYAFYEDVLAGRPAIREPFLRNASRSLGYFAFRLALAVLGLVFLGAILAAFGTTAWTFLAGDHPDPGRMFGLILVAAGTILPFLLLVALLKWFVHDVVIPVHLSTGHGFGEAFREAFHLAGRRPLAVLLYGVARLVAGLLASVAMLCLFLATCCLWLPPLAVLFAVLLLPTAAFPPIAVLTVPLLLVVVLGFRWLAGSLVAPWPVFVRAWALAFVEGLWRPVPSGSPREGGTGGPLGAAQAGPSPGR